MTYKIAINKMALDGKLPDGDPRWEPFNNSFVNQELETLDIANAIYRGHSYTAWHRGRRNTENFDCAQFIAVDLETHDKRSTLDYLRQQEFIKVYGGLIYTTPRHTEADPRARVLFFLDQPITEPQAYKTAIEFVYHLIPGSDTNCIKASGFFYGSKDCQWEWIDSVLPLIHLRSYYNRWRNVQPPTQHRTPTTNYQPRNTNEKEVSEALSKIDPWKMDYNKWISVLAALHDELGDSALQLAVSWAQGKPGEVERKWKSFGHYSGRKTTLATVFGMASGKVH